MGSDKIVATGVAIIWGLTFALIPVGWSTWITRSLADQAEKAGSIQVAVIQLANTCGAAIGGYALDNIGLTFAVDVVRHIDVADCIVGYCKGENEEILISGKEALVSGCCRSYISGHSTLPNASQ